MVIYPCENTNRQPPTKTPPKEDDATKQQRMRKVYATLKKQFPNPKSELRFKSAYTCLVAVILSAQATDKSVNIATPPLFEVADTPSKMVALGEAGLLPFIKSIGLFRAKAKNIVRTSKILLEKYGGEVPLTKEDLLTLPGVGQKTASVVQNVWFNIPTIAVDTHIFRVAHRLHLSAGKTPEAVQRELESITPTECKSDAHHCLLLFGRYICTARNPKCDACPFAILN